jgi:hypothetical protein
MARLGELTRYFDAGLTLTVCGREYSVPPATAETGLWVRTAAELGGQLHAAQTEEEMRAVGAQLEEMPDQDRSLRDRMLGPDLVEQMADDGVPDALIEFCARTAYIWVLSAGDEERTTAFWTSGGRPEARRPANRADRRAASRTTKSTGAATGTRSRASTSGTSTRRKSASNGRATGSRGSTSTPTGT